MTVTTATTEQPATVAAAQSTATQSTQKGAQTTVKAPAKAASTTNRNNSALKSNTTTPTADRKMTYLERTYDPAGIAIIRDNGKDLRTYTRPDNQKLIKLEYNCTKCGNPHFTFEHPWLVLREQGKWPPETPSTMAALATDVEDPFPNWVDFEESGKA